MLVGAEVHHILRAEAPGRTPLEGRRSRCRRPNEILGRQAQLGEARQPTTDHLKKTVHSGRRHDPKAELVGWPPPVEGVPGLVGVHRRRQRIRVRKGEPDRMPAINRGGPVCRHPQLVG